MKIIPLLLLAAAALGGSGREMRQPLFVIERSSNKNQVHYDANLSPDGQIDPNQPIQAYWVMAAQDGRREELTTLERARAYGFNVEPESGSHSFRLTLVAQKQRPIHVYSEGGTVRAETTIAGHRAYLTCIYANTHKVLAVPTVKSIDWFGVDVNTSEVVHETVIP